MISYFKIDGTYFLGSIIFVAPCHQQYFSLCLVAILVFSSHSEDQGSRVTNIGLPGLENMLKASLVRLMRSCLQREWRGETSPWQRPPIGVMESMSERNSWKGWFWLQKGWVYPGEKQDSLTMSEILQNLYFHVWIAFLVREACQWTGGMEARAGKLRVTSWTAGTKLREDWNCDEAMDPQGWPSPNCFLTKAKILHSVPSHCHSWGPHVQMCGMHHPNYHKFMPML